VVVREELPLRSPHRRGQPLNAVHVGAGEGQAGSLRSPHRRGQPLNVRNRAPRLRRPSVPSSSGTAPQQQVPTRVGFTLFGVKSGLRSPHRRGQPLNSPLQKSSIGAGFRRPWEKPPPAEGSSHPETPVLGLSPSRKCRLCNRLQVGKKVPGFLGLGSFFPGALPTLLPNVTASTCPAIGAADRAPPSRPAEGRAWAPSGSSRTTRTPCP